MILNNHSRKKQQKDAEGKDGVNMEREHAVKECERGRWRRETSWIQMGCKERLQQPQREDARERLKERGENYGCALLLDTTIFNWEKKDT